MIGHSSDRQRLHSILSSNSTHIGPEARLEFLIDKRKSFLCTEDALDKVAHVGMWHCRISVSTVRFADYLFCSSIDPSINRWAIFTASASRTQIVLPQRAR